MRVRIDVNNSSGVRERALKSSGDFRTTHHDEGVKKATFLMTELDSSSIGDVWYLTEINEPLRLAGSVLGRE